MKKLCMYHQTWLSLQEAFENFIGFVGFWMFEVDFFGNFGFFLHVLILSVWFVAVLGLLRCISSGLRRLVLSNTLSTPS